MAQISLGRRLEACQGIGPGFDFMRILLATGVVVAHASNFMVGDGFKETPWWLVESSILPMFFALSGFLVTASAMRLRLKEFLIHRGARIAPALFVEICLSALVLGPALTTLPLREYFSDPLFFRYFLNIFGMVQLQLPGLFNDNNELMWRGVVNISLWTIPHELFCYVIMSFAIYFGVLKKNIRALGYFLIVFALFSFTMVGLRSLPAPIYNMLQPLADSPRSLVNYFVVGCVFYLFRYRIPFSTSVFIAAMALYIFISLVGNLSWPSLPGFRPISAILYAYIVIFLGLSSLPKLPFYSNGDYSYGIYLYGFPLQQATIALFPDFRSLWLFIPLSIFLATVMAVFSWHVIEKPALRFRKYMAPVKKAQKTPVLANT